MGVGLWKCGGGREVAGVRCASRSRKTSDPSRVWKKWTFKK